jgi:regulator of replication initiation timing
MKAPVMYDDDAFHEAWRKSQSQADFGDGQDVYDVFQEGWNACYEHLAQAAKKDEEE